MTTQAEGTTAATTAETTTATTTADTTAAATTTTTVAPVEVKLETTDTTTAAQTTQAQSTTDTTSVVEYEPTGDPALDVALGFVGKLGITMDHPAMMATANGDFSLIKAHLATMGDKATGWEQMVALAEQSYSRTKATNDAKDKAVSDAVVAVAGGADNWNTVKAWAAQNATPAEKAEINAMFDAGPVGARAAAQMLVDLHAKASGTVVNPASATRQASAGAATTTNGPLSAREYHAAVRDLHAKLGNRMDGSPEYAALRGRLTAPRG